MNIKTLKKIDKLLIYKFPNIKDFKIPYTYTIWGEKGNVLRYVGTKHTYIPNDPIIKSVKDNFFKLKDNFGTNFYVIKEGDIPPSVFTKHIKNKNIEEIVIRSGNEMNYITFLCYKYKIKDYGAEPDKQIHRYFDILSKKYPADVVKLLAYILIRHMYNTQFNQFNDKDKRIFMNFPTFYLHATIQFGLYETLKGFETAEAIDLLKKYTTEEVRIEDHKYTGLIIGKFVFTHKLNKLELAAADLGRLRDVMTVKKILKLWEKGKSILVVYGALHAIAQEKALKKLLK